MGKDSKWIQKVVKSKDFDKGGLHRRLGIPKDEKIPKSVLKEIKNKEIGDKVNVDGKSVRVDKDLKRKVNFALNVMKSKK